MTLQIGQSAISSSKSFTRKALPEKIPEWGITVIESHHTDDFVMEWRRHDFIKIIYALKGSGRLLTENDEHSFCAKDTLVVPRELSNRIVDSPNNPSSLYILCLSPTLLSFDQSLEGQLYAGSLNRSDYVANRIEAILRRLLFQQSHGGEADRLAMASSALNLMQVVVNNMQTNLSRNPEHKYSDKEMSSYVEYLDSHFFEAKDLSDAAKRFGMSRRTFTNRFRKATGMSWLDYVREKAIEHACGLLLETSAPVSTIAFECGFSDLSTFYRHFKSRKNISPSEWRKRQRLPDKDRASK